MESDDAHSRDRLQSEMDRLTLAHQQLAICRNSTLPIHRLPPDILSTIFLINKEMSLAAHFEVHLSFPPRSRARGPPYGFVPWIAASHVCSLFRQVALDCALLWNTLFLNSIPWTQELIRRSNQAPLHIYHSVPMYAIAGASLGMEVVLVCLRLALSEHIRIETLDLSELHSESLSRPGETFADVLDPSLFPEIRRLHISLARHPPIFLGNHPSATQSPGHHVDLTPAFLQSLLENRSSQLISLHLSRYTASVWSGISIGSLTRLHIESCPHAGITNFFQVLERHPQLEHLAVIDCPQIDSMDLSRGCPGENFLNIPLPFLRTLHLSGILGVGCHLLRSLVLPQNVKLSLMSVRPHSRDIVTEDILATRCILGHFIL